MSDIDISAKLAPHVQGKILDFISVNKVTQCRDLETFERLLKLDKVIESRIDLHTAQKLFDLTIETYIREELIVCTEETQTDSQVIERFCKCWEDYSKFVLKTSDLFSFLNKSDLVEKCLVAYRETYFRKNIKKLVVE